MSGPPTGEPGSTEAQSTGPHSGRRSHAGYRPRWGQAQAACPLSRPPTGDSSSCHTLAHFLSSSLAPLLPSPCLSKAPVAPTEVSHIQLAHETPAALQILPRALPVGGLATEQDRYPSLEKQARVEVQAHGEQSPSASTGHVQGSLFCDVQHSRPLGKGPHKFPCSPPVPHSPRPPQTAAGRTAGAPRACSSCTLAWWLTPGGSLSLPKPQPCQGLSWTGGHSPTPPSPGSFMRKGPPFAPGLERPLSPGDPVTHLNSQQLGLSQGGRGSLEGLVWERTGACVQVQGGPPSRPPALC